MFTVILKLEIYMYSVLILVCICTPALRLYYITIHSIQLFFYQRLAVPANSLVNMAHGCNIHVSVSSPNLLKHPPVTVYSNAALTAFSLCIAHGENCGAVKGRTCDS